MKIEDNIAACQMHLKLFVFFLFPNLLNYLSFALHTCTKS